MSSNLQVLQEKTRALLSEVMEALRQGLREDLLAVVLFGSRSRGEGTQASDWDLLVIARHLPPSHFQRHLQLKKMLPPDWRAQIALLARTPAEFEAGLSSLMLDIALDGVVLFDPDGYAASRLAALRDLIERRGLRRERFGNDWTWKWKKFPGFDWTLDLKVAE